VETVSNDATLVLLLKVYMKMFIPSGKILDFHKTFVYGLMTKSLFGRSFVDNTG
jgi:hypothetical protein